MVRRSKLGTYVSALCVFLGDAPRENVRAEACPPPAPRSPGDEPSPRVPRRGCARTLARSRALGARARPSKQVICNGNPDPKPETHTSAHTAHRAGCRGHLRLRGRAVLRRRGPGARRAAGLQRSRFTSGYTFVDFPLTQQPLQKHASTKMGDGHAIVDVKNGNFAVKRNLCSNIQQHGSISRLHTVQPGCKRVISE